MTVFNLISKLFNVPLLNITTSFVAEEQAVAYKGDDNSNQNGNFFYLSLSLTSLIGRIALFCVSLFYFFEVFIFLFFFIWYVKICRM